MSHKYTAHLHVFSIYRRIPVYPYYRIDGPPEYKNMTTKEVLRSLDWTNSTIRQKYQELLLEENVEMEHSCLSGINIYQVSWEYQMDFRGKFIIVLWNLKQM